MKRIEIGADLNGLELAQVGRVLVTANELKRFFEDLSDSEIEFERLYEWEKQLVTLPTLSRRLKEAVDEDGRLTDEASPELRVIRQNIRRSERTIRETLDSLVRGGNAKYLSDTIVTMRNERYVIPVKQEYRGVFGGSCMIRVLLGRHYLLNQNKWWIRIIDCANIKSLSVRRLNES